MKIKFRKNIEKLKWYSSWKEEFSWNAEVFLDTNENPYDLWGFWNNRYPDPMQIELKRELLKLKNKQFWVNLKQENIMVDNWSDNIIDLVVRMFCEPKEDSLAYFPPTFWMYKVVWNINNVKTKEYFLDDDFKIKKQDLEKIYSDNKIKLIFLCNPNNPSWNIMANLELVESLLKNFNGIVVIDEAYIDFCPEKTSLKLLKKYNNLVVLQTFSKFWGLAGARCWMAFSSPEIIQKLNTVKAPYNVSNLTQKFILKQMKNVEVLFNIKDRILEERKRLELELRKFSMVKKIYKSDSNFLLIKFKDAESVFSFLKNKWIIVRNFSSKKWTENCLRITIWTEEENSKLLEVLGMF